MRKVIAINCVPYGSTIKISLGILEQAQKNGYEVYSAAGFRLILSANCRHIIFRSETLYQKSFTRSLLPLPGATAVIRVFQQSSSLKKSKRFLPI